MSRKGLTVLKGKFVIGASLPRSHSQVPTFGRDYVRHWNQSAGARLDVRQYSAYVDATGNEPRTLYNEGLALEQWQYGLPGPCYSKSSRASILERSRAI